MSHDAKGKEEKRLTHHTLILLYAPTTTPQSDEIVITKTGPACLQDFPPGLASYYIRASKNSKAFEKDKRDSYRARTHARERRMRTT